MEYRIIAVDDDHEILELCKAALNEDNYKMETFKFGNSALREIRENPPHLIILDLTLPDMDGLDVCRILKSDKALERIPVMMVTARSSDEELGFDLGADHYITKPFSPAKLRSRVKAILRRDSYYNTNESEIIEVEEIYMNVPRREVKVDNKIVGLTSKQFNILRYLMKNPDMVVTKDNILNSVWGYSDFIGARAVDTNICRLRKKLGEKVSKRIQTVPESGYMFSTELGSDE